VLKSGGGGGDLSIYKKYGHVLRIQSTKKSIGSNPISWWGFLYF
jgi:hypothetical protein